MEWMQKTLTFAFDLLIVTWYDVRQWRSPQECWFISETIRELTVTSTCDKTREIF